jgi:uncharacterized protein (DUF58 family)
MIRPTRRAVLLLAAGTPLPLLMLLYDQRLWSFALDYCLLFLLAVAIDAALSRRPSDVAAAVAVPHTWYVGEPGLVTATIAVPRHRRPVRFDLLCDYAGAVAAPLPVASAQDPGRALIVDLPVMPSRRGMVSVERLWLRWRGPLGLVERQAVFPVRRQVAVVPNLRAVKAGALAFFTRDALFGMKTQRQRGAGTEFEALREYVPGLDPRHIDWKHSARHRKALCKEFEIERNHQIVLALDTGHLMREDLDDMPRLDHCINAGLLLAWLSLRSGDLVGLYAFDAAVRTAVSPVRGTHGFGVLQQAAARLDYHADETNFTLGLGELGARLKRRTLIILFTDFVDTVTAEFLVETMQRVTARHLVLFVTLADPTLGDAVAAEPRDIDDVSRAIVADDLLRERRIVLARLRRLGVQCLEVAGKHLPAELLNRYLMIKRRDQL